jgi:hypothetical protein
MSEIRAKRPSDTALNVGVGETEKSEADYYVHPGLEHI